MASEEQKNLAQAILRSVGEINPYNSRGSNQKSEYYIYTCGYMAGYLASLFLEDPIRFHEFKRHLAKSSGKRLTRGS